jgi:hypothetical protein
MGSRLSFRPDRALTVFVIVLLALAGLGLVVPDVFRPLDHYFAWGGADVVGIRGWMYFCIAIVIGAVAGLVGW